MEHRTPGRRRRRGPLAWLVFIAAILATLTLMAGCLTLIYRDAFTGL